MLASPTMTSFNHLISTGLACLRPWLPLPLNPDRVRDAFFGEAGLRCSREHLVLCRRIAGCCSVPLAFFRETRQRGSRQLFLCSLRLAGGGGLSRCCRGGGREQQRNLDYSHWSSPYVAVG